MSPKTPENSKNRQQPTCFDIKPSKPLLDKPHESSTNTDKTSYHPDQAHWSINNLPAILYVLRPGPQHRKSRARVLRTPTEVFGKHIRDFSVLPSQISSQVEGWRLEAWWRLDRRIEAQDILDRIDPRIRANNGVGEAELEIRREDFRRGFRVADWKFQVSMNDIDRLMRRRGLDPAIDNSTRGVTPGLIDPEKGECAGRIPIPVSGGPVSPFFVLRGLERPAPSTLPASLSNGNRSVARNLPNWKDGRLALNPHQYLSSGLLPSYTPIPPVQDPPPQKRVASEPIRPVTPSPKKQKSTTTPGQQVTTARQEIAAYPESQCGLASHQETPIFREQRKGNGEGTMTLEEYLNRNRMTFEEYLCRDEDEQKNKQQGNDKRRAKDRNILVTTSSKGTAIDPWLLVL